MALATLTLGRLPAPFWSAPGHFIGRLGQEEVVVLLETPPHPPPSILCSMRMGLCVLGCDTVYLRFTEDYRAQKQR
ncbi:hypothetical protein I79_009975 [Cricetulus griseus]|uniref:Uncharacterized protein n=1 Tax=Cricetulus griseus TaxID=10029 RepID=G3HH77_CRIGR|nr:hypothetical protein I79_009975 [Cricetulus griseus]